MSGGLEFGCKRLSRRSLIGLLGLSLFSLPAVFVAFRRSLLSRSTVELVGPLPSHNFVSLSNASSAHSKESPEVVGEVEVVRSGDADLVEVKRVSLEVSGGTAEVKVIFQFLGDKSPERKILVNAKMTDQDGHELILGQHVQGDARLNKPESGPLTRRPLLTNIALFEVPFNGTQESVSRILVDFQEV